VAGSAKTPQLDPVVQEALKDVTSRTHPRTQFLPRRALLALRKLLAPYLTRRGIFQGGPAPMEPERSLNDPSARTAASHITRPRIRLEGRRSTDGGRKQNLSEPDSRCAP